MPNDLPIPYAMAERSHLAMWLIAALIGLIVAVLLSYGCYVIGYYRGKVDLLDELRNRMEG